jgi:hypothetical protein
MRAIKCRELRRMYEGLGAEMAVRRLREALNQNQLAPEDFSIRELADSFLGESFVKAKFDPRAGSGFVALTEDAFSGVDVTAFSNITGQLVYNKLLAAYAAPGFVASRLVPNVPTRLDGEKIAGIDEIGDKADVVNPGMPYPNIGFGENYIETPATTKRGFIVPVTKEAIFFDRTNLIFDRARDVGNWLGVNKEKRLIDTVWGIGSGNTYKSKGTTYDTYSIDGSTAGYGGTTINFINQITDELVDWTDCDAAEQVFAGMTDPATSEPITVTPNVLWVQPAYRNAALRIVRATDVRFGANADTVQTYYPSAYRDLYQVEFSALAYARIKAVGNAGGAESVTTAKKWWLLADLTRAFAYMENWPVTVTQAPLNNEAEFTQDVVLRFKASERGTAAVLDPRYVVRSNPTHA